jgi:hypothetical protein
MVTEKICLNKAVTMLANGKITKSMGLVFFTIRMAIKLIRENGRKTSSMVEELFTMIIRWLLSPLLITKILTSLMRNGLSMREN